MESQLSAPSLDDSSQFVGGFAFAQDTVKFVHIEPRHKQVQKAMLADQAGAFAVAAEIQS